MTTNISDLSQISCEGRFVVCEEDTRYPLQMVIQTFNQNDFNRTYSEFVSPFSVLKDNLFWGYFQEKLEQDGWTVYMMPSAQNVLDEQARLGEYLKVENFHLPSDGDLYPYQQYGIRKALNSPNNFFFFNWGTGCGKTLAASAGAQELFNQNKIDIVLVFSLRKMKINLTREFNSKTSLVSRNIEGTKAKRRAEFAKHDARVYVMNYEKANFDYDMLEELIKGKRVLFVMDEVQKILTFTSGMSNKAGQGIRKLIRLVKNPYVWAMSATVIGKDPERFWRLFDLPKGVNGLGYLKDFKSRYVENIIRTYRVWGDTEEIIWNQNALEEVRHRISSWCHTVRKSDPGVRELFKEIQFIPVPIQLSEEDRKLYDLVEEAGRKDKKENWGEYYRVLKYICGTTESLKYSESEVAKIITEMNPNLSSDTSATLERLLEDVERIRDQGDKVVVFCSYTNLGLFRVSEYLSKNSINHVNHFGTGMSDTEAQKAQDDFKQNPSITVFLSSDAGAMGLNFQEARYVIHFDIPYSYDLLRQRSDRIDRVDSYLEGLTVLGYYAENTVQERIWKINNERRILAETVQGTEESLSRLSEEENLKYLMGI